MKNNIKRNVTIIVLVCTLILVGFLSTYAYFVNLTENNKNQEVSLEAGTMSLTFSDGDNGINASLNFGETVTKKFILENTGTLAASISLDWLNLINTYIDGSLSYKLSYSDSIDGEYIEIVPLTNIPVSNKELTQPLSSEISVPEKTTYYYELDITLNYLDNVDQTNDLESTFQTQFTIGEVSKYRYYSLSIDPNGGTWKEFTSTQEYQLQKDEELDLPNPTREGYTFNGWEIKGISSSILDNVFKMGISDTELKAKWNINKYQVTIDLGDGNSTNQEVEFGSTVELPENPSKEGYTFGGWDVTGGTLNGNTLTITDPDNVTVTAKWNINKYKYIVYHNKMNIDGNGYTLVDSDTDEGEADYNSQVTPGVKSYPGFSLPPVKDLTIKHETVYPPVLNKVEYNYDRNKYTLTLNLNGGVSEDPESIEMYYEAEKTLKVPTKVGYNFTNWTITTGTVTDNTFKMSNSNSIATANYTPKTFTVTYNANGGKPVSQTKTVTYDSKYIMPNDPTYEGYEFLGWFTAKSGGTQITSNTDVKLNNNQTLYAHWKKDVGEATLVILKKVKKSGNPKFAETATTDETADGLYSMTDDYGTSYYYRGNVEDNYVKFAGFYWRIIRVNGDGSLRIIYDGTSAHINREINEDRLIQLNQSFNINYGDAKYVGYMYAPAYTATSTSKEEAQTNTSSSDIKTAVEAWYKINIADKGYDEYVGDNIFCNDRSTPGAASTGWTPDTGLGYGANPTGYGALARYKDQNNPTPKLTCNNKNDAFTKNDTVYGNGALSEKVGLITVDEISIAGGREQTLNQNYYLCKGNPYWSLSPGVYNGYSSVFFVSSTGLFYYERVNRKDPGIAPVISLTPEYVSTLIGDGTMSNPFRTADVEP